MWHKNVKMIYHTHTNENHKDPGTVYIYCSYVFPSNVDIATAVCKDWSGLLVNDPEDLNWLLGGGMSDR